MATKPDRSITYRNKLKASGGGRLNVAINSEAMEALRQIISCGAERSQASAVTSALLAYRNHVMSKPDVLTRLAELEQLLATHLAERHIVATELPPNIGRDVARKSAATGGRNQQSSGNARMPNKTTADHEAIARVVLELRQETPNRTLVNMAPVILERFPTLFTDNKNAEAYLASTCFSEVLAGLKIQVDGAPQTAPNEVPNPLVPKGAINRESALLQLATTPMRE